MGIHHAGQDTYILVCDLPEKVKAFRHIGLKTPDVSDPFFREVQTGLVQCMKGISPGTNFHIINMEDLADEIFVGAERVRAQMHEGFIISTCPEIAAPMHGATIEVNRMVDEKGRMLGIGPRAGHPPVEVQISGILERSAGSPLVLMEDGSFTGNTLRTIIEALRGGGGQVEAVVVGFIFPEALRLLSEKFSGEIIQIEQKNHLLDWTPDHDYFPFIPNCGRTLGTMIHGNPYPFYTFDGYAYSVPYLVPYAPFQEWVGLRGGGHAICEFSSFCLEKTRELFAILEKLNGRELTVGDLWDLRPRVAIPYSIGQESFAPMNSVRITDYLSEVITEVW